MGEDTRGVRAADVSRLALLLLWVALLVSALLWGPDLETLQAWVEDAGAAAPLAYLSVYLLGVFAFLPRPALNAAAGLLFGMSLGLVLAVAGGVCAALAQFWVARHVAGDAVARRLPEGPAPGWRPWRADAPSWRCSSCAWFRSSPTRWSTTASD